MDRELVFLLFASNAAILFFHSIYLHFYEKKMPLEHNNVCQRCQPIHIN